MPPARLVTALVAVDTARLDPAAAADPWSLVEAATQAVALVGAARDPAPSGGLLVAIAAARWWDGGVGELLARVEPGRRLGALHESAVTVSAAGHVVLELRATIADSPAMIGAAVPSGAVAPCVTPLADAARARRRGSSSSGVVASGRYRFTAALPVLAGHFPGHPLLPGVHLLACVQDTVECHQDRTAAPLALRRVRFTAPVVPPVELAVTASLDGSDRSWRFIVSAVEGPVASGRLSCAGPADP